MNMRGKRIGVLGVAVAVALALLASGPVALADEAPTGDNQGQPTASDREQIELALAQGDFKAADRHGL
ncbi:MAG: hypothetical protein F2797_04820, partial [Actinobacteria bacterium]|nr:hypothetical protein [Actinomycetota bacterium]